MMVDNEADLPFGGLPQRDRVRLARAQIDAAVAEVRVFPGLAELSSDAAAVALRRLNSFGVVHTESAEQREVTVTLGPTVGPQPDSAVSARGWQFFTADRSLVFTLMPSVGSVQVLGGYERWSTSLRPQLEAMLTLLGEVGEARLVQRVGLRYLNRLAPVGANDDWLDVVDPTVAGVLAHPVLGALVRSAHQQFELALEPTIGAVVRHGPLGEALSPDGYLVDLDVFDTATAELDVSTIANRAQRLNRTAFTLFTQCLTEDQLQRMHPEPLEAPTKESHDAGNI